ncbi:MAG: hypothetical protein LBS52_08130 [Dysgonamonadaceae bacterium]|jgi:hypothetical protein|nr:hypothetical protein [Dysgonamonadaceae bacterium]
MKDIVITSKIIKRELRIWLACFLLAFLLNIVAICIYKTSWVEAFSQIGYVLVISIVCYALLAFFRLLAHWLLRAFRKGRK